jgi:hypothetical protein
MKCLTPVEISVWLRNTGQVADPRSKGKKSAYHITFNAPPDYNYQAFESYWECIIGQVVMTGDLLIVVADADPSLPCQDFIHDAIRKTANERRSVLEAPGYSIDYNEREKAIALLSLSSCFGWKCYLYANHDQTAFLNWEGKIFDFWTDSESKKDTVEQIMQNFGLSLSH